MIVPAVCLITPVAALTVPDTTIVPAVLNVIVARLRLPVEELDQVPFPFITKLVVPDVVAAVLDVTDAPALRVNPLMIVVVVPLNTILPVTVQASVSVYVLEVLENVRPLLQVTPLEVMGKDAVNMMPDAPAWV